MRSTIVVFAFLFAALLPCAHAADLEYFCGFECQSVDEASWWAGGSDTNCVDGDVDNTDDSPWEGVEDWYLDMDDVNPVEYFLGLPYAINGENIHGAYIQFFGDKTPANAIDFMCGVCDKKHKHYCLQIHDGGGGVQHFAAFDANGAEIASAANTFLEAGWYLVETRWTKSDAAGTLVVRVNSVEVFNLNAEDISACADTDAAVYFEGALGPMGVSTDVRINSAYAYSDGGGDGDFIGPFQVVGPHQTNLNTGNSDNGTTNLTAPSTWDEVADTPPNAATTAMISGGNTGYKRTNGAARDGPATDTRINADGILGGSWLAEKAAGGDLWLKYGRYETGDTTYDVAESPTKLQRGQSNDMIVVGAASGFLPSDVDYFVIGWRSDAGLGSGLEDAWAFILQTPATGRTELVNPKTLLPGGLVGGR
jgi:hypothetical protein